MVLMNCNQVATLEVVEVGQVTEQMIGGKLQSGSLSMCDSVTVVYLQSCLCIVAVMLLLWYLHAPRQRSWAVPLVQQQSWWQKQQHFWRRHCGFRSLHHEQHRGQG